MKRGGSSLILPFLWKSGDVFHFAHDAVLTLYHVGRGGGGAETAGIGERGGYQGALGTGQFLGRAAEMTLGNSVGPIDAVAHLYGVEIDLHDALLAPHYLYETGEIGFKTLSHPRAPRP